MARDGLPAICSRLPDPKHLFMQTIEEPEVTMALDRLRQGQGALRAVCAEQCP